MRDVKRPGREKGQSIAELALLLPVLILILLGCLDLGRAFSVWVALTNGTREGARYGCAYPPTTLEKKLEIESRTQDYILGEGLSADALHVGVSSAVAGGQPIAVTAIYSLPLTTMWLFGGQPVTITARTQMQILPGGL